MFKGVSQYIPSVSMFYFGLFNPFEHSPLPLYIPPFFNNFQYTSLYPQTLHLMVCDITDALSFSFPFFFPRVVLPLLQTCSTVEFV
jgi:hypothetical protein